VRSSSPSGNTIRRFFSRAFNRMDSTIVMGDTS
jgi:hypothetical protein